MRYRSKTILSDEDEEGSVDLLFEFSVMTKGEMFAFLTLRDGITSVLEPYIQIRQTSFTVYQKNMFKAGVNILITKGLVKRVSRGSYMLNPQAIVYQDGYSERKSLWDNL